MQWIKDIVTGLVETYGTRDINELLDLLEVKIIKKTFINPDVKARLYKDPFGNYYIYLSSDLDEKTRKHILCHELGHILLHNIPCEYYYSSRVNKDKLEYQANYFASLLLLDINDCDPCYLEGLSLEQLSSYFEMPKELIQYSLDQYDLDQDLQENKAN
jgi:Zn-dependent peptidase ImmA (M78 family)